LPRGRAGTPRAIGGTELKILFDATAIMLAVIIPVILLTIAFAWWFRAGNTRARYLPIWEYSGRIGLPASAVVLTLASFGASSTDLIYAPGIPVLLAVLAVAQMGVYLVFFLHISSAPHQTNNFLALAFGIFVVGLIVFGLIVFGSMIIMTNLNHAMMPMDRLMQMQR
jgi:cytochrome o ubiquinol oxidase subunit IV